MPSEALTEVRVVEARVEACEGALERPRDVRVRRRVLLNGGLERLITKELIERGASVRVVHHGAERVMRTAALLAGLVERCERLREAGCCASNC